MPYLVIKVLTDTLTNDIVSFEQLGPYGNRVTYLRKSTFEYFRTAFIGAAILNINENLWRHKLQ